MLWVIEALCLFVKKILICVYFIGPQMMTILHGNKTQEAANNLAQYYKIRLFSGQVNNTKGKTSRKAKISLETGLMSFSDLEV